ncbi:MAG: YdcF family protein, partial [Lachnospiraceae bacterium]|nr:YdcF family protein [Lachnospiraceae bacterium]
MIISTSGNILTVEDARKLEDVDAILVLGASVHGTKPSAMLRDRLDRGIELYQKGISDTMLMSGDASTRYYNEVMAMELYAVEAGVPETAIIKDPKGLCTYNSIENAVNQYGYRKILIVTQ